MCIHEMCGMTSSVKWPRSTNIYDTRSTMCPCPNMNVTKRLKPNIALMTLCCGNNITRSGHSSSTCSMGGLAACSLGDAACFFFAVARCSNTTNPFGTQLPQHPKTACSGCIVPCCARIESVGGWAPSAAIARTPPANRVARRPFAQVRDQTLPQFGTLLFGGGAANLWRCRKEGRVFDHKHARLRNDRQRARASSASAPVGPRPTNHP